jgi:RNA binding exosome subunit
VFLNVSLRTFCHATEDCSKVEQALEFLLPDGATSKRNTTGHHGNPIVVYEVRTDRKSEAREFWKRMMESIASKDTLADLDSMVDEDCILHARLDKQKAYLGEIEIVKHEDVIAVSSKIESYPKKREIAIKNASEFFGSKR